MSKLRPCPFCGKNPTLCIDDFGRYLIQCHSCRLLMGIEVEDGIELEHGWKATFHSQDEAAASWNSRIESEVKNDEQIRGDPDSGM